MIDLETAMANAAGQGFGDPATPGNWFNPDAALRGIREIDAKQRMERETLARMWAAVAATPAGAYVLDHLMREHILRASFDVPLMGGSMEQVAMFGIWRDGQKQLVNIILGLAGRGRPSTAETTHDRRGEPEPQPEPGGDAGPERQPEPDPEPGGDAGPDAFGLDDARVQLP